jgi:hypothetical protein
MKILMCISIAMLVMDGCGNKQAKQIESLAMNDSALMKENAQKDSSIIAYVKAMNEIQDNLDSIKVAENILSVNTMGNESKKNIVGDIRRINIQLLKYHREIYSLERKLKLVDSQNRELQKLEGHLARELAEKDSGIAVLQVKLAKMNDSLVSVIKQFNDSMVVINTLNGKINNMTTEMNTVYYAIGTTREFKKHGVITKEGGFAGIGRTDEVKKDLNTTYFTRADMEKLMVIPLLSRFEKLLSNHPASSYTVTDNHKSDSLIIKYPGLFWSISKYLVVVVK